MEKETLTEEGMRAFTGTENWYQHPLNPNLTYTDGARYVAEAGGAYWLLDEIAIANMHSESVKREEFQVWALTKKEGWSGAWLHCSDGNGKKVYFKKIEFTDFPLPKVELWCTNNVILLPSEN